jgi:two-component system response regulator MtrA
MLTALTEKEDELKGLYAGADDYITKPYDTDKILARIKARFRTVSAPEGVTELRIGPLEIDVAGHEVRRDGERISLTPLEFSLLQTLAEMPKQVFSREMLLEKVWGYQYKADTRLVNVHVQRLRSKIEDDPEDPKIVVTERGVGYKAGTTS